MLLLTLPLPQLPAIDVPAAPAAAAGAAVADEATVAAATAAAAAAAGHDVFPLLLLLLSLPLPLPQRQRQRREDAPRSACFRDPSAKPSAILPRKINQSIVDSAVLSFWIMACRAVPWTILPRNLPRNLPQSFRDPSAAAAAAKQSPQQILPRNLLCQHRFRGPFISRHPL